MHGNKNDCSPFAIYLLQILYACYRELDRRYAEGTLERVPKAKRVERLLMDTYVPISKAEICERLPEVSVRTVERAISRLDSTAMASLRAVHGPPEREPKAAMTEGVTPSAGP